MAACRPARAGARSRAGCPAVRLSRVIASGTSETVPVSPRTSPLPESTVAGVRLGDIDKARNEGERRPEIESSAGVAGADLVAPRPLPVAIFVAATRLVDWDRRCPRRLRGGARSQ